jgi:hypothetical protein
MPHIAAPAAARDAAEETASDAAAAAIPSQPAQQQHSVRSLVEEEPHDASLALKAAAQRSMAAAQLLQYATEFPVIDKAASTALLLLRMRLSPPKRDASQPGASAMNPAAAAPPPHVLWLALKQSVQMFFSCLEDVPPRSAAAAGPVTAARDAAVRSWLNSMARTAHAAFAWQWPNTDDTYMRTKWSDAGAGVDMGGGGQARGAAGLTGAAGLPPGMPRFAGDWMLAALQLRELCIASSMPPPTSQQRQGSDVKAAAAARTQRFLLVLLRLGLHLPLTADV